MNKEIIKRIDEKIKAIKKGCNGQIKTKAYIYPLAFIEGLKWVKKMIKDL